jgi:hypothetical protein
MKGMPGNIEVAVEAHGTPTKVEMSLAVKLYYANGKLAAKAYGRKANHESRSVYWRRQQTRNGRFAVWQELG